MGLRVLVMINLHTAAVDLDLFADVCSSIN